MTAPWTTPVAFATVWRQAVDTRRAEPFLVFEGPDGTAATWTYAEFDGVVRRAAGMLQANGVTAGDAVHLALTNSPAFVAVWLAANGLGAWIVPSDPAGSATELRGHVQRTRPGIGFCAAARSGVYREAAEGEALTIVEVDEADVALDLFGSALGDLPAEVEPGARAAVMFTSGTTGAPKGVEITQANYAFTGATMAAASGLEAGHRQLVVLPMFHANAQFYSFASAIWAGASVALMHTFSASGFLGQAARHRATHASLFAAPIRMILARSEAPAEPAGLQHCWYAMNITAAQHATLSGWLGCPPRQLYGMTETIPAVLSEPADHPVPWSMGFPTAGCRVDIEPGGGDDDPDETRIEGSGEIVVGGRPGITLFAGYLDDPVTTERSFLTRADGSRWFLTGDRAHRDADGRFLFDGRRSDVLKVAGENVSTVEVEEVLSSHPGVLEAAVVGKPDPIRDEVPVGFVVAADAATPPSVEELMAWCSSRLTKSKQPRDITLVDQLPRTSVGKIRKFLLRDAARAASHEPASTPGAPP